MSVPCQRSLHGSDCLNLWATAVDDLLSCAPKLSNTLDSSDPQREERAGSTVQQRKAFVAETRQKLYEHAACMPSPTAPSLSIHQLRPGDAHSLYSSRDTDQSLHPDYMRVLHHASQLVGCREAEVADAVCGVETALIKMLIWRRKGRETANRERQREEQGRRRRPGRPRQHRDEGEVA